MSHSRYRNEAFWSVVTQIISTLLISILVWIIWNLKIAGSFAVGGTICVLPNIYLYRRVFSYFGARQAKQIVKAFYWGEATKFILIAGGFLGSIYIPWIFVPALFFGFLVAQIAFWVAPIFIGLSRVNRTNK